MNSGTSTNPQEQKLAHGDTNRKVQVHVKRQESPGAPAHWEVFEVQWRPNLNVIAILQDIQIKPVTVDGKTTTPVVWDAGCLEEVCGACSMLINGRPRQACSALVDRLEQPIRLEPFSKFPIVRDLVVDRNRMFEHLKRVKAWVNIDGTHDLGPGPKYSQDLALTRYRLSECFTCGCCLEACPQYGPQSNFIGPQALNQVRLFNSHPTGSLNAPERLESVMGDGGVEGCGDAQNCVQVCPKQIPLTESIGVVSRDATKLAFKKLFGAEPK